MATGVRNNTGILILVFSIYIYLVCNFVVSHFPTIYNNVPMGDIVAGTDNPALRHGDRRLFEIRRLIDTRRLLEVLR